MLKNCKDGFFHMESFKLEIFLGWKIQGFFRILIIEKEKFIFWEFPICWNITGIEFLPIETIWNYWLIFELFHLGPNSPALNGQIDYQISNKKLFVAIYVYQNFTEFHWIWTKFGLELFHIKKLNIELFQVKLFNLNCSILKS